MYILFSIILFIKKKGEKRIRVTTNTHDTHTSNRPIVRTRNLSKQVSQGSSVLSHDSVNRSNMGSRFIIAILTIIISGLKFVINMLTIGISFITKKEIPMVDDWIPKSEIDLSEKDESLKRSIYVVEHNENPQVEWGEYNPKIREVRDLLD